MSFSVLEITAIPQFELLDSNIENAKRSISSTFRDLLTYFSSINRIEQTVIELIIHKYKDNLPRFFITVRSDEQTMIVPQDRIISTISSYLLNAHYTIQRLNGESFTIVVSEFRDQLTGRIIAITKNEKLITSNLSYSGYYYYADVLESIEAKTIEFDNYNSLITQLMTCEKAMVTFQLIPTRLTEEEYYALSNLSAELTSTTQGLLIQGRMVRETTAEAPKRTYTYYTERALQPLFIGNIIVASNSDEINGVVAALKFATQQSLNRSITLSSIELESNKVFTYDLFHFPWNVYNQLLFNYRDQSIWNGTLFQPMNLIRLPFLYSVSEASVFFRLPINDNRINYIHSNNAANDNETVDQDLFSANNIQLGHLLNTPDAIIGTSTADFTQHALIVGTPGSGKTTFAINLLLQFAKKGIPFLVIEPTKTEYRALIDKIQNLQVFTPGNSSIVPFIINPFIPPKGIRLEQYIPSLMSAFKASFSMETPLEEIFLRAINQCYSQYGWKNGSTCTDLDIKEFGLFEFILVFKKIVATSSYKSETIGNIVTGGTFRLLNLLDKNKYIFDTIHTIPITDLLEKPTILELNAIADDELKSLIMALLLIDICLYTKHMGSSLGELKNVFLIDEAHVLLDMGSSIPSESTKARNMTIKSLQKMIAEIRAFGTGIIIADQKPSKVTSDIVADTDLKVSFRLVEQNERNLIANSTHMTEYQAQHLARLKKGEAFVYSSKLNSPKIITTQDTRSKKGIRLNIPDEEIASRMQYWKSRKSLLVPFFECTLCPQCASNKICNSAVRERGDYYASHINSILGANIKDIEALTKYMFKLHELIIAYEAENEIRYPLKMVCNCTKIHFIREVLLTSNLTLNRTEIANLIIKTMIKEAKV